MKYHILILSLFTSALATQAQSIHFSFTNGAQQVYELEEVGKFTFTSDSFNLHLISGELYSWHLDSMNYYQYQEGGIVTALDGNVRNTLPSVKIYPNPSSGQITLEYTMDSNVPVTIEIINMQGSIVNQMNLGIQHGGQHSVYWDAVDRQGRAVPPGTYLCNFITPYIRMSRTFIIY